MPHQGIIPRLNPSRTFTFTLLLFLEKYIYILVLSEFMRYGRDTIAIIIDSCFKVSLTSHQVRVFQYYFCYFLFSFCYVWNRFIQVLIYIFFLLTNIVRFQFKVLTESAYDNVSSQDKNTVVVLFQSKNDMRQQVLRYDVLMHLDSISACMCVCK